MAKRPNYGQERAERHRRKAARRDERLAARAERRGATRPDAENGEAAGPEDTRPVGAMPVEPAAMARLVTSLAFVCGPEHPVTLAVRSAALSGGADDIERARTFFLQLSARDQRAALAIAAAAAPPAA